MADLKPEAACFYADDDGQRAGSIVFDMKETSQIPAIAEIWFHAFHRHSQFFAGYEPTGPGAASIEKAAKSSRFTPMQHNQWAKFQLKYSTILISAL